MLTSAAEDPRRSEWYLKKTLLASDIAAALHCDPTDPLDSCNVLLLDDVRSHESIPSIRKRRRDDGEGLHVTSKSRFHKTRRQSVVTTTEPSLPTAYVLRSEVLEKEVRLLQRAADTSRIIAAVDPSGVAMRQQQQHAARVASSGSREISSVGSASSADVMSPLFEMEGDALRCAAAYLKRVEWIEKHRRLGTFASLTEAQKVAVEMQEVMDRRKKFSRARKDT